MAESLKSYLFSHICGIKITLVMSSLRRYSKKIQETEHSDHRPITQCTLKAYKLNTFV